MNSNFFGETRVRLNLSNIDRRLKNEFETIVSRIPKLNLNRDSDGTCYLVGEFDELAQARSSLIAELSRQTKLLLPEHPKAIGENTNCRYKFKFFCSYCQFKCTRRNALSRHLLLHKIGSNLHKCKFCNFATFNLSYFNNHKKRHVNDSKIFRCSKCTYSCFNRHTLSNHRCLKHTVGEQKKQIFHCEFCTYFTSNELLLSRHNKKHSRHSDACKDYILEKGTTTLAANIFECDVCKYKFTRRENLTRHIERRHVTGQRFTCNFCSSAFKHRQYLTDHLKWSHSTEKSFECKICSKRFRKKGNLQQHMETHEIQNSLCEICGKSFKTSSSYRKHRRIKHFSLDLFKCETCCTDYSTKYSLERHSRSKNHLIKSKFIENSTKFVENSSNFYVNSLKSKPVASAGCEAIIDDNNYEINFLDTNQDDENWSTLTLL